MYVLRTCGLISFFNESSRFYSSCRVVMNASALPDPKEVSYDVLLRYVDPSKRLPAQAVINDKTRTL